MAIFNFYFASCVLLLTLSWRTSTGLPVCTLSEDQCEHCSSLFNSLLLNVKDLLNKNNSAVLCYGISSDRAVVKSKADTVLACAPTQSSGCMMQRNSPFSELECRRNIMKDLAHYAAAFESYINSSLRCPEKEIPLLKPTLGIIQSLRKDCCLMPNGERDSSEEDVAQMWGNDTFNNRQEMCKMMRGFYVRVITINRAMGYISSGEHRM
ncbi:interleukin-12 subunit alpha [Dicentrarchus labrax]|uniref:Interleukin-12 subunit alpha n=2 Tax=Dicentrarchus labrax TaxID=13489 RepID=A0A8C4GJ10_DICLA|nr:interleukin-12 subunit alpha [Dicentrarchus labrax]